MPALADTFMLTKFGQSTPHLWIVITTPDPNDDYRIIMVNVTTQHAHSDPTTVLVVGDHPFIRQPSVVYYSDARCVPGSLIDGNLRAGLSKAQPAVSSAVLLRIQSGIDRSTFTPQEIKDAFAAARAAGLA